MIGAKQEPIEIRRKHLEAALVDVQGVKPQVLGEFRARLVHLRNIGCPDLPKPGSGQHITYTPAHALEVLIALELENLGQSPRYAASQAASIVRQSPHRGGSANADPHGDMCAIITQGDKAYTMIFGETALHEFIADRFFKGHERACSMINVTACARSVFAALEKALSTER